MGRLFEKEIMHINQTYKEALSADTEIIEKFLGIAGPVLIVGSGGSYSAAKAIEYQFNRIGMIAKAITPLQLEEHQNIIYQSKIILLTARGNNNDILNAFKYCKKLEAMSILCLCLSTKSKIHKEFSNNGHLFIWEKDMSFGKDGYLSVNSLIAMITVMANAIYHYSGDKYFALLPEFQFSIDKIMLKKYENIEILNKETIVVMHGGSTTQIAVDLESKFSEVALGNIQLVDYRNFAHGRHYWMLERGDKTGIIALIDIFQNDIAIKTLQCIPKEIPCEVIQATNTGILSVLELYIEIFYLVYAAGINKGINPGKPKVPEYGKKLYHMSNQYSSINLIKEMEKDLYLRAAYRKYGGFFRQNVLFQKYVKNAEIFYKNLARNKWKCLIFDYDATLHWKGEESDTEKQIFILLNYMVQQGVKIAIATGRGKSVRKELQEKIIPQCWSGICIGYYNGAICGWLDDNNIPQQRTMPVPELRMLYEEMNQNEVWKLFIQGWEEPREKQWSLGFNVKQGEKNAEIIFKENVYQKKNLKVVSSSHSIDVISQDTSKSNVVDFLKNNQSIVIEECLFIGDFGSYGGNDFEMLRYNGLSVDLVSKNDYTCWNIAPLGKRQLEATLFYLQHMEVNTDGQIEVKKMR